MKFQSTPPGEVATPPEVVNDPEYLFQSTPPGEVATELAVRLII